MVSLNLCGAGGRGGGRIEPYDQSMHFCEVYALGRAELFSIKPSLITEDNGDHF